MFSTTFRYKHNGDRSVHLTETFHVDTEDVNVAEVHAQLLGKLLPGIHGDQTPLVRCRIADPDGELPGRPIRFKNKAKGTITASSQSDYPTNALTLVLTGATGGSTTQWIKGIREDMIDQGGKMNEDGDWIKNWEKIKVALTSPDNNFCMRVLDPATHGDDIMLLSENGVVHSPAHGLTGKTFVRITAVKAPKYANRIFKAIPIDADNFQLYGYKVQTGIDFSGTGLWRVDQYVPVPIKNAELVYASKKDVSRPT